MSAPVPRPGSGGEAMPPEFDPRHLVQRLVLIGAAVVAVAVVVSTVPGLSDLRSRVAGAQPSWLVVALVMEIGSTLAFVAVFKGVLCRRLAWRLSYEVALSEQAANVLLPTAPRAGSRSARGRSNVVGCRPDTSPGVASPCSS